MTTQRVFQGSLGRFTVAVRVSGTSVVAAASLCGNKDQFVRRVGFHRATGLLLARRPNNNVFELADYTGTDVVDDVIKPLFDRLQALNTEEFATSERRVASIRRAI